MTRSVARHNGANQRRSIRMPNSVGNVGPKGDVDAATEVVINRIAGKGPHMIMVSPEGDVFPVLAKEVKSEILAEDFPTWIAGWFNFMATATEVADDLEATYQAQQGSKAWKPV